MQSDVLVGILLLSAALVHRKMYFILFGFYCAKTMNKNKRARIAHVLPMFAYIYMCYNVVAV